MELTYIKNYKNLSPISMNGMLQVQAMVIWALHFIGDEECTTDGLCTRAFQSAFSPDDRSVKSFKGGVLLGNGSLLTKNKIGVIRPKRVGRSSAVANFHIKIIPVETLPAPNDL